MYKSTQSKKSIFKAYFCWLFGGLFGLHHFYLRRDFHALAWWTTLGGFGIGWLREIFYIPKFVRDANDDPQEMRLLWNQIKCNRKPPFSLDRFTGMWLVGYVWCQLAFWAIPPDDFMNFPWRYFKLLVPLAGALGVWVVGNIGREKGSLKVPLLCAYAAYPLRYYIFDESIWLTCIVLFASLGFDSYSKEWRREPPKRRSVKSRILVLAVCAGLYLSLWTSYIYFHGTIVDSDGDEIPIQEAIHNFLTSPWWLELEQCLYYTYNYAQHHGWYEVWKQIIDFTDPHGELNAYKVLGVGPDVSQQEITSTWRRLSRENHPDKVRDMTLRKEAQKKFMEIQQAYEILSNKKNRRQRKNKRNNQEPSNIEL